MLRVLQKRLVSSLPSLSAKAKWMKNEEELIELLKGTLPLSNSIDKLTEFLDKANISYRLFQGQNSEKFSDTVAKLIEFLEKNRDSDVLSNEDIKEYSIVTFNLEGASVWDGFLAFGSQFNIYILFRNDSFRNIHINLFVNHF